jgi:uncharacterized protein involved in response to NO
MADEPTTSEHKLADVVALLTSAPHRLMFLAGASAVLVSMAWWAMPWSASYFGWLGWPSAPVPAGWAHAVFAQYGMFGPFILGFLLTVFPRWQDRPSVPRKQYLAVFGGVFGGYLLAHVGLLGIRPLLIAGLGLMLFGWAVALAALSTAFTAKRDKHVISCYVALVFALIGLGAFLAFVLGAPWQLANFSIKIGTFGFLLPVFFTVSHRLIPFFSANVVGSTYKSIRPLWSLPLLWVLLLAHLGAELTHHGAWLWLADLPLLLFFLGHWLVWRPWRCRRPSILLVLYLAFAWLPVAFALYTIQSMVLWTHGDFVLGRAPVHALTVGFLGSMLVAMVTRVTLGHSGRPLQMGVIPWVTFGLLQLVVVARIYAELAPNTQLWLVVAAIGWLVAFLPWVLRSLSIYLTPRPDGKPG